MKLPKWVFIIVVLSMTMILSITACTTFHGITPISPKVGDPYLFPTVESLQPTLRWQPVSDPESSYDLVIYEGITITPQTGGEVKRAVGERVYYREGLRETAHQIEQPLKPDTEYYWAVRIRRGAQVAEWSHYDYRLFTGMVSVKGTKLPFRFQTPKT